MLWIIEQVKVGLLIAGLLRTFNVPKIPRGDMLPKLT